MDSASKRMSLTLPNELIKRLNTIKQKDFYDKSYSEMFRQLLADGLKDYETTSQRQVINSISNLQEQTNLQRSAI